MRSPQPPPDIEGTISKPAEWLINHFLANRRFRTMEAASLRLQKEAKGYLDSLRGRLSTTSTPSDGRSYALETHFLIADTAFPLLLQR